MQLLTRARMRNLLSENTLCIDDIDDSGLQPSFYYFRLGARAGIWNPGSEAFDAYEATPASDWTIKVPPRGYVLVHSIERFALGQSTFALIGQHSQLARVGLRLNFSPSIDPGFSGWLELGMENLLDHSRILRVGQVIGKVIFFDVSDSGPIEQVEGAELERRFFHYAPLAWLTEPSD